VYVLDDDGRQLIAAAIPSPALFRFAPFDPPEINNLGQIAFSGLVNGEHNVFLWDGESLAPILGTLGTLDRTSSVSLNDFGDLAFLFFPYERPQRFINNSLMLFRDGETQVIAGPGLPLDVNLPLDLNVPNFLTSVLPTLNNRGQVAFVAQTPGADLGIFVGPDPLRDRVITTEDLLDGAAVWSLTLGKESLNDHGQLVFGASLSDGRTALFRADPIPEPAALALAVVGGLMLTIRLVRRGTYGSRSRNVDRSGQTASRGQAG
jgi:hypothetical protein